MFLKLAGLVLAGMLGLLIGWRLYKSKTAPSPRQVVSGDVEPVGMAEEHFGGEAMVSWEENQERLDKYKHTRRIR